MKKVLFLMILLISTAAFANSRDEAFDQKNGALSLLAFGRPPVPTAKLPEIETTSDVKSLPDITPPLPDGGTGVITNLGSSATPGESLGTGGEVPNSGSHENQDSSKAGKNRSGGADGTNPGDHGNDSGTNNPGKGKGKKN